MGLQWVRLDANINQNDKVMRLLGERDGYRAFTVYVCALGWSGGQGTDGFIPRVALPYLHGTTKHANLLVVHRFWDPVDGGWVIRNWADRQEMSLISEAKREARHRSARRANCVRWHKKGCECWQTDPETSTE